MDNSQADDPQSFPKPQRAVIVDGVLISASGVGPLEGVSVIGPVMLADREGVFVHSWKCLGCRVEFVVFSWLLNRHRVGRTFCPECGQRTPMIHWRDTFSASRRMIVDDSRLGHSLEIFDCVPCGDADLMDDSSLPG